MNYSGYHVKHIVLLRIFTIIWLQIYENKRNNLALSTTFLYIIRPFSLRKSTPARVKMPKPKHLTTPKRHNYSAKKPCFHRHLSSLQGILEIGKIQNQLIIS